MSSLPEKLNAYHPSLTVLSENEWLISFDLGVSTETLDYHTRRVRSLDAGRTWQDEGPILDRREEEKTTHTLRVRRLAGRRLLGFGKWEERNGYEAHRSNRETLGQVPMRLFWIESTDGGHHWSPPRWIEPPLVGPTWELCHPIIELPDKSWAAPVATWRGWNGELPNGEQTGLLISRDSGITWPTFSVSFDGRKAGHIHWEQSIAVRKNGELLATAWKYDPHCRETLPSVYSTSRDGGVTFSHPQPTGFHAQTCKIIELRSGRIAATYRRHDQRGLWFELARVDDTGWYTERRGLLWGGSRSGMSGATATAEELNALSFGYPSMAELPNGEILLAYWRSGEEGQTAIHWVRFDPEAVPNFVSQ